jgi:hypothetical protein
MNFKEIEIIFNKNISRIKLFLNIINIMPIYLLIFGNSIDLSGFTELLTVVLSETDQKEFAILFKSNKNIFS